MSVHELSEDELDLLADFTAGVLSPTEHDRIAWLIGADNRWAAAHADLRSASAAVRADLRAVAGPLRMPTDVAARINAAISSAQADERGGRVVALPDRPRSRTRHAQPPSRWRRAGLTVAGIAAAAVVVVGGVGVVTQYLHNSARSSNATSGSAARPEFRAAAPSLPGGPATMASGRDYQPGTLGQLATSGDRAPGAAQAPAPAAPAPTPSRGAGNGGQLSSSDSSGVQAPKDSKELAPGPLERLTDPDALRTCLAQVQQLHPGTQVLVDFAEFQGSPALVIVVRQATKSVAVVVGPDCGRAGADERYVSTIG